MTNKNPLFKFFAALSGTLLALLLIEFGFRAAGDLMLARREKRNLQGLNNAGTYRILCLGESTTQEQWPPMLEKKLNESNLGIRFKVIDKGQRGTFSAAILSRLDEYLDQYQPQMVVTMMGINDGYWVWKNALEYQDTPSMKIILWLKDLRINKLATFVSDGLKNRWAGSHLAGLPRPLATHLDMTPYRPIDIMKEELAVKNPTTPLEWGRWYRMHGDYPNAESSLRKAVESGPETVTALIELGNLYREESDFDKAKKAYEEGIKTDPHNPYTYIGLGNLFFVNGKYQMAEEAIETGVKASPSNAWIRVELGDLYQQNGNFRDAERIYNAVIKETPSNEWVYFQLTKLYDEEVLHGDKVDAEKFEKLFLEGINAAPKNPWPYIGLGYLRKRLGRLKEAEKLFNQGIKIDPTVTDAYVYLGNLYMQMADKSKAKQIYKTGIKIDPKEQAFYTALEQLYYEEGDIKSAEDLLKLAIKSNPKNPSLYLQLNELYRKIGDRSKAEGICEEALKLNADSPWIYIEMAKMYLIWGEPDRAEEVLLKGQAAVGSAPEMARVLSLFSLRGKSAGATQAQNAVTYPPLGSIRNYQKLRDRVLQYGAKLVCVQYPMRDIRVLKEILGTDKEIIFVDNKNSFEQAIKTHDLTEVFRDLFAGNFGHCTPLGNKIIADNISDAILHGAFKEKQLRQD